MSARDAVRRIHGRFSGKRIDPVAELLAGKPEDFAGVARPPLDYDVEQALQDRVTCCLPRAARPMFTLAETVLLSSLGAIGGALLVFGLTMGGG